MTLMRRSLLRSKGELRVLGALIADVERLSPSASGPFTVFIEPIPVIGLFQQTVRYVRTIDTNVDLTIDCTPDLEVLADGHRIQQVLRNLVVNALRYGSPGAPIELKASRVNGGVRIQVSDRGPGISPRLLPMIFQKRVRGPRADSSSVPGKGLGLYICREIVEAHGSHLEVHSPVQGGAIFSFDLRCGDDRTPYR